MLTVFYRNKACHSRQKGFAVMPIIIVVVILLILGAIFLKSFGDRSPRSGGIFQNAKNKVSQEKQSDLIDGYPRECEKQHGFDNYRTDKSFTVDPKDSQTMYVAVEYRGVFKSKDGGKTWNAKSKGLRGYPSKKNPQEPCREEYSLLIIDPSNPKRLLLAGGGAPGTLNDMNSEGGGLHESLDGGESWHQLFSETMNAYTHEALTLDPTNSQTIYAGTAAMPGSQNEADPNKLFVTKGIIYKTTDGGKNWQELPTGFIPHLRSGRLFADPADSQHLMLTTIAIPPNRGGGKVLGEQFGILETRNGGGSWEKLESLPKDQKAIRESDIAPLNFDSIFLTVSPSNEQELKFYSTDGGKTFKRVETQVNLFRYDPHDPKGLRLLGLNLFVSLRDIFESLDGGKTWHSYSQMPKEISNESRVSNIVWDPNNKNVVYLNGDEGKVWKSEDNAKTWQLILSLEMLK